MTEPKKSIADALNVTGYDEGFAANADRAVAAVPGVGTVYETGKSIAQHAAEMGQADDFGDLAAASGKLLGDGAAFVGEAAMDVTFFAFDPIGDLVSAGLDILLELVQPLQDALHMVTGDGPSIGHASDNFVSIAMGFVDLADEFEKTGDAALKDWLEDAGDAARAALADFSTGIRGVGSSAGSVAEVLRMWSMVMVVIEEVVKAIIAEFASWAITIWARATAMAAMTWGASLAEAMVESVVKAGKAFAKVTRHLGVFGRLLDDFMALMAKLSQKMATLAERFRVGRYVEAGERALPLIGKAPIGRIAEEASLKLSRRVRTYVQGTEAGVGPLLTGMAVKAGIGGIQGAAGEASGEVTDDGPLVNESELGGDQSVEDTRENLDM